MSAPRRPHRLLAAIVAVGVLTLIGGGSAIAASPSAAVDDREGPQFASGVAVDVAGPVDGDVFAAGQSVTISGDVRGDVIAAAQTITITGTVDGDVRLAAQDVSITGEVARSATVFAASLTVTDTGSLGGDVLAAAGRVTIAGEVGRDVLVSVERIDIDGRVGGDLTYVSANEARISAGAVAGSVERIEPPQTPRAEVSPWAVFVGWLLGVFYALVALSIVTLCASLVFPRWLRRVTDQLMPAPWKALLVGFVAAIAVPVALVFLAVTFVGAPLALAGALVWMLMRLTTFVYGAHYIGRLVFRDRAHPVVMSLVGGVILIVALQIPWLNIVVWLAMVFFGLGAQLLEVHRQHPWRRETPEAAPSLPAAEPAPVSGS